MAFNYVLASKFISEILEGKRKSRIDENLWSKAKAKVRWFSVSFDGDTCCLEHFIGPIIEQELCFCCTKRRNTLSNLLLGFLDIRFSRVVAEPSVIHRKSDLIGTRNELWIVLHHAL